MLLQSAPDNFIRPCSTNHPACVLQEIICDFIPKNVTIVGVSYRNKCRSRALRLIKRDSIFEGWLKPLIGRLRAL
jgi:hypothetical protein